MKFIKYGMQTVISSGMVFLAFVESPLIVKPDSYVLEGIGITGAIWLLVITAKFLSWLVKEPEKPNIEYKVRHTLWSLLMLTICYGIDSKYFHYEYMMAVYASAWFIATIPVTISRLLFAGKPRKVYVDPLENIKKKPVHEQQKEILKSTQEKNLKWEVDYIRRMGSNENRAVLDAEYEDATEEWMESDYFKEEISLTKSGGTRTDINKTRPDFGFNIFP